MPETKPEQMNALHAAIMNLPCKPRDGLYGAPGCASAYREGHRDARHAAAELVLSRAVPPVLSGEAWMEEAERLLTEYVSDVTAAEASAAGFDRVGLRSHMQSAEESRAALLAHLRLRAGDGAAAGQPIELAGVAEELASQSGFWRSCSGCHESNEGHPTGPYSEVFKCHLGVGCRECGGLGAVWDDTDYDAMADFMAQESHAPSAPPSCASSTQELPEDVRRALDRMCTPLHESILKGATAEADARSMRIIREFIESRLSCASSSAAEPSQVDAPSTAVRQTEDERAAALEARVAQLEQAAAHNAPAMQAAWMHVPIGGAR